MAKIHIILLDNDVLYSESFTKYIFSNHSHRLEISTYIDEEAFRTILNTNNEDIYLVKDSFIRNNSELYKDHKILCLTTDKQIQEVEGYKALYKYQNIENIISEIFSFVDNNSSKSYSISSGSNNTKIISFFSPIGGSGKTSISAALATKLSRMSQKVLYINLESIPSTDFIFHGDSEKTFTTVLYSAIKKQNLGNRIEGSKVIDNVSGTFYFKPHDNALELLEVSDIDYISIIDSVRELKLYDYIIFDMPSYLTPQNYAVLNNSDCIIFPFLDDGLSSARIELMMKQQIALNQNKYLERTIFILNKSVHSQIPEWTNSLFESHVVKALPMIDERNMSEVIRKLSQYMEEDFLQMG